MPMKAHFSQKLARKIKAAASQRFPQKSRRLRCGKFKNPAPVGTETELSPGEPLARTFTVQVISAETIAAGFPFGIRINVAAADPVSAVGEASDQLRRLCDATRAEFVETASRALRGA